MPCGDAMRRVGGGGGSAARLVCWLMCCMTLVVVCSAGWYTGESHYDILGVSPKATLAEIKAAYREQALIWHPDKNTSPEAVDRFMRIQEAWEVLSDERERSRYDWGWQSQTFRRTHTRRASTRNTFSRQGATGSQKLSIGPVGIMVMTLLILMSCCVAGALVVCALPAFVSSIGLYLVGVMILKAVQSLLDT